MDMLATFSIAETEIFLSYISQFQLKVTLYFKSISC